MDPRDWLEEQGLADPIYVKAKLAYLANDLPGIEACSKEQAELQNSRLDLIKVYRDKDFIDTASQLWQASERLRDFHVVLGWDVANRSKGDEAAQQLTQRPEIATLLAPKPKVLPSGAP